MADVFISYSRKDIEFAQRIHQELEARDRQPWVDWQDIPPPDQSVAGFGAHLWRDAECDRLAPDRR